MTSKLSPDQEQCASVLGEAHELAKEGKIQGVAISLSMDRGCATLIGGRNPGELNLGLDQLKAKILSGVMTAVDAEAPKPKSSLILPRVRP